MLRFFCMCHFKSVPVSEGTVVCGVLGRERSAIRRHHLTGAVSWSEGWWHDC